MAPGRIVRGLITRKERSSTPPQGTKNLNVTVSLRIVPLAVGRMISCIGKRPKVHGMELSILTVVLTQRTIRPHRTLRSPKSVGVSKKMCNGMRKPAIVQKFKK